METALATAFGTVSTDVLAGLATVAPIALTILGTFLVWKYGVKFFKSIVG